MDKEKVIELLNKDIQDEHGAIIQYLSHAYGMGEGEMACEIEAMARDEMRHLDWLAETIVELGGVPSLERGTMKMGGASVHDWMVNNVALEQGAITQYKEQIEAIDDPKIKRLLRRILSDEEAHRDDFEHFVEKSHREAMEDVRGTKRDDTIRTLNWGIEHEYTVILQYLLQRYLTPNEDAAEELEDQAINEMQHLGWLAEKVIGMGGTPIIEHIEVDKSTRTADMLSADIKIENEVADAYDQAANKATDAKLKKLFLRLRDNEIYHAEVFGDLLEEEKKSD
ncbi:MAG: ferritin-like domain-containing protein [Dehalococcoidales bacterium]|nr:MAG: ferritin-like domain-containing protein [Dehalococcoidales bacterium]